MSAFDRAWEIAKMARHNIGPTSIWDASEQIRGDDEKAFLDEKGLPHTFIAGKPSWWDDWMKNPDNEDPKEWDPEPNKVYVPISGSPVHGDYSEKVMMTPTQFRQLAYDTPREDLPSEHNLEGLVEAMKAGLPMHIPNLSIERPWDGAYNPKGADWKVGGHEGRHRMQALIDMGYGDVPIPVTMSSSEYMGDPYSNFGGNEKYRNAIMNTVIAGQGSDNDHTFTVENLNRLYGKGVEEDLL